MRCFFLLMKMKSFNFALLASWFFLVFLVILSNDLFVNVLLFPTLQSTLCPFVQSRSSWRLVSHDTLCRLIQPCDSPLTSRRRSRWPWSWSVSPWSPCVVRQASLSSPSFLSPVDKSTDVRLIRFTFADIFQLVRLYATKCELWLFHVSVWWFYNPPVRWWRLSKPMYNSSSKTLYILM